MRKIAQFTIIGFFLSFANTATSAGEFAGPLFGLTTAPNGDILVADAGSGVVKFDGSASPQISLPGITDISTIGRGSMWAIRGAGPEEPGGAPNPQADTGQALFRLSNGKQRMIANLFEFEVNNDPDTGTAGPDSNPFDVASLGGHAALVADAGGNDLLRINKKGEIDLLAVFPTELASTANFQELIGCGVCAPPLLPAQPVPTSIAIGPDGNYYVGELKGFPAPTDESRIWRVSPDATGAMCPNEHCVLVFDGGFTSIIDLAFDASGILYVVELDERSWFAVEVTGNGTGGTVNSCDVFTLECTEVATDISEITAITFGKDGSLWGTRDALIPGEATVVQLP